MMAFTSTATPRCAAAAAGSVRTTRLALLVVALLLVLARSACALVEPHDSFQIGSHGVIEYTQQFGFLAGGTYFINLTLTDAAPPSASTYLLVQLCSTLEMQQLPSSAYPCKSPNDLYTTQRTCAAAAVLDPNNSTWTVAQGSVPDTDLYTVLVYSCDVVQRQCLLQMELVNPGGNQLSSSWQHMPQVYYYSLIAWTALAALWIINRVIMLKTHIPLHYVLLAVMLARLALAVALYKHWLTYAQDGIANDAVAVVSYALMCVFQMALLIACQLISKGWCISRQEMAWAEMHIIFFVSLCVTGSVLVYQLFSSYFLVAVVVMYVIVLRQVFSNANTVINFLEVQAAYMEQHEAVVPRESIIVVDKKVVMLRSFRRFFGIYVFLTMLGIIAVRFFAPSNLWLQNAAVEVLDWVFGLALLFLFYLRNFAQSIARQQERLRALAAANVPPPLPAQLAQHNPALLRGDFDELHAVTAVVYIQLPSRQPLVPAAKEGEQPQPQDKLQAIAIGWMQTAPPR